MATQNPIEQEGHLPAARGSARPLHAAYAGRLSGPRPRRCDHGARPTAKPRAARSCAPPAQRTEPGDGLRGAPRGARSAPCRAGGGIHCGARRRDAQARSRTARGLAEWLRWGASPRAAIAIERGARALAWLDGRDYVSPEDVQAIAPDALRHRSAARLRGRRRAASRPSLRGRTAAARCRRRDVCPTWPNCSPCAAPRSGTRPARAAGSPWRRCTARIAARTARARSGVRGGAALRSPATTRAPSTGASRRAAAGRTPSCSARNANGRSGCWRTCMPASVLRHAAPAQVRAAAACGRPAGLGRGAGRRPPRRRRSPTAEAGEQRRAHLRAACSGSRRAAAARRAASRSQPAAPGARRR